jgi:glycosyltransferase involved in cell wall biosynthesis
MEFKDKVLIIVQNLPVPFDRRVWLEATSLDLAGYQVSVICPKGKKGKYQAGHEILENVHIYRYPPAPEARGTISYLFEFVYCWLMTSLLSFRVWRSRGFDILHACNPPETFFLLGLFYKLFGKRFIFDHHDLSPEMYLAKGGKRQGFLYNGLLWLERQTFKTADVIITTNQSHKKIAMSRGGVPEDRIFIVRSGPDLLRLQVLDPEESLKGGFSYLACYLGEMCPQDGIDYLLRAIQVIIRDMEREDVKFVLMGGGPALDELQQLNSELGLDSRVVFTGRVSDDDLCRYLSTADICLDPDPYTEWADQSTMNKIMEYMAFGKPIVAFDLKEHRFSAQNAAVYAPPNDINIFANLILELLDQPQKRLEMGEFGLQRVKTELAWSYSEPFLLAAYQKAMNLKAASQ